ncbi:SPOSA6832_01712, partial [Sporobolomyces salmonicolor]
MSRTTTAVQPLQQQQQESSLTADHERRIAALEAALYALQLSAASQPRTETVQPQKQQFDHSQHQHGISTPMTSTQQYGHPSPSYGTHSPAPFIPPGLPGSRYDFSTTSLKHESDGSSNLMGDGRSNLMGDDQAARHRDKRWRGEAGEPDFIARGVVSEEEASLCFESYFLTFATTSSLNEQRHLTFPETRARSPLFLATVISIGARSLSRFDTFHATLREALHLAHETMILVDDARQLSLLTLKSILLLGLHQAMPQLLLASMFLGHRMGLSTALQEFNELREQEKQSKRGRALISKGRIFFVSYIWTALCPAGTEGIMSTNSYSFGQCEHGFFDFPIDVLRHQLDILQGSAYAENPTDFVFRTHLEENLILLNTFKKLGPGMSKNSTRPREEVYAEVDRAIGELEEWDKTFADMMVVVSQWGDSPDLKAIVPFHHGRQALMRYIFRPGVPLSAYDREDPKLREYAKMTIESALVILKWGVESRIWMPFSVVGAYVHHVNIPTALSHLFMAARLFPCDADFLTIRPLLHRLLKHCDVTIRGPGATRREIQRAERTKAEVMEFDRFAFEASGEEGLAEGEMGGGGGGGMLGGKGVRTNPHGGESNSLFGDEITASLNSLRLELNLWAAPLRSFEEDD